MEVHSFDFGFRNLEAKPARGRASVLLVL